MLKHALLYYLSRMGQYSNGTIFEWDNIRMGQYSNGTIFETYSIVEANPLIVNLPTTCFMAMSFDVYISLNKQLYWVCFVSISAQF